MRNALFLLLVGAALSAPPLAAADPAAKAPPARPPESSCITCHAQLEGAALEPTKHTTDDIHFLRGLSCDTCHGGNPAAGADGDISAAHDEGKAYRWRGKPKRIEIPVFCGTCHADAVYMKKFNPHTRVDQLSEYRTSEHGKRNAKGDEKVAVCVDCHGVHGIRAVSDTRSSVYPTHVADTCARCHTDAERMRAYNLPTHQYADYKTSVHARALYDKGDLSAPSCKSCHGSHGAVPPGVESIANVCGSCHGREVALAHETEVKSNLNTKLRAQCVVCHGNHAVQTPTDEMVGVGPKSMCTGCHPSNQPLYETVRDIGAALENLKSRLGEAKEELDRAERAGIEVSADQFALQKGQNQLVELRALVHAFDKKRFLAAAQVGLVASRDGSEAARRALAELHFRRVGLGVSLLVILAVIGALVAKLREVEKG